MSTSLKSYIPKATSYNWLTFVKKMMYLMAFSTTSGLVAELGVREAPSQQGEMLTLELQQNTKARLKIGRILADMRRQDRIDIPHHSLAFELCTQIITGRVEFLVVGRSSKGQFSVAQELRKSTYSTCATPGYSVLVTSSLLGARGQQ
jgi:hypothetical protein